MKLTNRWLLWFVFAVQLIGFVGFLMAVAWPLAQRSASDLAGLMLISAKTFEELPDERRVAFAQSLLQDTGVIIERGVLPDMDTRWRPHWYADWVAGALRAQGETQFSVMMQQGQVQVSIVIDSTPVLIRADSPKLGAMVLIFFGITLLAMFGTLLALWWQKRWQTQMLRTQVMLSGLSHDLRTPLTRLRLSLALLPTVSDAEQQVLNTHVQDINGLIDTALALSAGRHRAQVALAPLWTRLQTHYPDVVFQIEDAALLERAVSPLLARIVQNLIDNALAHGQGLVRVCLLLKYKEISLSVCDEGQGVPNAVWRAIEQQEQPKAKGVGLGLLTSYWLAQSAGYRLQRKGACLLVVDI